jgi:hypothetical protein
MRTSLPRPIHRSFSVWIAALVCLGGAACFRSKDPAKIKCINKASCPTGYSCFMDNATYGHCEPGATDSGSADLPSASGGTAGTTSVDGPSSDGAAGAGQGGTSGSHDGAQIDQGGVAGTGGGQRDVGGTAGSGGTIGPDASMGTGGALPGTGGTTLPDAPAGTGGALPGTGGTTLPDAPAGTGGALPGAGGTTSQRDAPMDSAGFANGSNCTSDGQCSSARCVDGVCCATACTELCKACNLNGSKGTCTLLASGQPVHGTACTSDSSTCGGSCNGSSATACYYPTAGQSCGTPSCSGDLTTLNASACNGSGSCGSGSANQICSSAGKYCDTGTLTCATKKTSGSCTLPIQCSSNACCNNSCVSLGTDSNCSACGDACVTPKTCQGGACACGAGYSTCGTTCCSTSSQFCGGGTCSNKRTNGNSCAGGDGTWCTSGYCVDNTCCASSSCGPDQTCSGGTCVCSNGYFYSCGNSDCTSWNFESGSLAGISTNGVLSGLAISTTQYHGGTHSLKAHIKSTQNGDGGAILIPLCRNNPGHSTYASSISFYMMTMDVVGTFPTLGNYMAWVDDCSGSPVGGAGMGSTGGAWSYKSYTNFISTFDLCTLRFQFGFGAAYEGDVYIDDIQLTSP